MKTLILSKPLKITLKQNLKIICSTLRTTLLIIIFTPTRAETYNFRIEYFYLIPKPVVHSEGMKSLSDDSELWQQLKHHKI